MKHHDDEKAFEDFYFGHGRKEGKVQRKLASSKDRSKYKKTDQEKYLKSLEKEKETKLSKQEWLQGRVLSILPQDILVEEENEKQIFRCVLKGLLKKDKTLLKNLIVVGDLVLFEKTSEDEGVISQIKPRRTILSRADNLSRRKEQLIAANIDQVFITLSVMNPALNPFLADRYMIATKKGGMDPIIVVNKIDLLQKNNPIDPASLEQQKILYEEFLAAYSSIGIRIIPVSAETGEGIVELKDALKNKSSVFSGQSGVGKSSLINIITGTNFRVRNIVDKTNKGAHTTSTANLVPLEEGGWCIDTPGIKSFGVWDLKADEIKGYFPEIDREGFRCKFPNCTHTHEDDCSVKIAIDEGKISLLRYESYLALMTSVNKEHQRR